MEVRARMHAHNIKTLLLALSVITLIFAGAVLGQVKTKKDLHIGE